MGLPRRSSRLLAALVALASTATACSIETKDFDDLFGEDFSIDALETAQSSRVWDRNGTLITELRGEQNRTDISFADIPEMVQNAVVAIEDERFWEHSGVDIKAILRAARSNVSSGGISQGGSTITQQYVGNVFLDRDDKTGSRKVKEIFMARRFEQRYEKWFILERYMNWVYFGNGAYGIEAAAREYFGAPDCARQQSISDRDDRDCLKVTELTLVEAATLAGLIQAPGRFNPYDNYQAARDRRDLVLLRMYANDMITQDEYDEALLQPIDLVEDVPILEEQYPAAYFVEDVKQWFLDNPRFGATREDRTQLLFEGGLDIFTTIDLELQAEAEAAVDRVLPPNRTDGRGICDAAGQCRNPDAAAVVMGTTPSDDGHVLALVGGRDFFGERDDAKFNFASSPVGRQAGSSMKPIGLAAALQSGIPVTSTWSAPSSIEIDNKQVCGSRWRVGGGAGGATVSLIRATRSSLNTVYAQVIERIRPERFVEMAESLGIGEDRIAPVCAAVLGTENVNMLEMATVFSTFKRSGVRVDPVIVTRIVRPDGTLLYEDASTARPVLSPSVADQISWVLTGVITGGTGTRAQLADGRVAAGKTGTTQNNVDATFIGYTAQRTTAVWVGFPDPGQISMQGLFCDPGWCASIQGGTYPALIFKAIMDRAHEGMPLVDFPAPPPSSTTTTIAPTPSFATVPDLIGRELTPELIQELEPAFTLSAVERETDEYPAGTIFFQAPRAGEQVPGGVAITVEVAITPQRDPVPDVLGLSRAEAKQTLTGFGYGVQVEVAQNGEADGITQPNLVWAQDPVGGTPGDAVETVTIRVNPPAEPEEDNE